MRHIATFGPVRSPVRYCPSGENPKAERLVGIAMVLMVDPSETLTTLTVRTVPELMLPATKAPLGERTIF